MPHHGRRHFSTATVLLITLGCSGSKALRLPADASGQRDVSSAVPSPDVLTGGSGGQSGIGSGGEAGGSSVSGHAATGGVAGGSLTVSIGEDASAGGGKGGTSAASLPGHDGAAERPDTGSGRVDAIDASGSDVTAASADGPKEGDAKPSGVCSEAPCLADLLQLCQPIGVCTSDDAAAQLGVTETFTSCYPNGVKQQATTVSDGSTVTARLTAKRDSTVCYVFDVSMNLLDGAAYYSFINGEGRQVGTGIITTSSNSMTVTCAGETPVQLSQACMNANSTSEPCNTGSCTF